MPGGSGGKSFEDDTTGSEIKGINLRADNMVNKISCTYRNGDTTKTHGSDLGREFEFHLDADECITTIIIWSWDYVEALQFLTNKGRASEKLGGPGGFPWTRYAPHRGMALGGFLGSSGLKIDSIEPLWVNTELPTVLPRWSSPVQGAIGGKYFNDLLAIGDSRRCLISKIVAHHNTEVVSIQVCYNNNKGTFTAPKHGGDGNSDKHCESIFELLEGEFITAIYGRSAERIDQISFVTNKGRHSDKYGGNGGKPFSWEAPQDHALLYFQGLSGSLVNNLCGYFVPNPAIRVEVVDIRYPQLDKSVQPSKIQAISITTWKNQQDIVQQEEKSFTWVMEERLEYTFSKSVTDTITTEVGIKIGIPVLEGSSVDTKIGTSTQHSATVENKTSTTTKFEKAEKFMVRYPPKSTSQVSIFFWTTELENLEWQGTLKITHLNGKVTCSETSGHLSGTIASDRIEVETKIL